MHPTHTKEKKKKEEETSSKTTQTMVVLSVGWFLATRTMTLNF
jgi:hypothetical protein